MSQRPGRDEELARLSDDTAERLLARADGGVLIAAH